MPYFLDASPECSVWLFKTIDRGGNGAASARYQGQKPYIDLTPFLGQGSSVRTSKSIREPAGGFNITFPDNGSREWDSDFTPPGANEIESIYGQVEPMDIIMIRMWPGDRAFTPDTPEGLPPIVMRGFVSEVRRSQSIGDDGHPVRMVSISGQDFGKIWQMLQVLYLPAYSEAVPLLTTQKLFEYFGETAKSAMGAGEFMQTMLDKVLNPYLEKFQPYDQARSRELGLAYAMTLDNHITDGVVNIATGDMQKSIYDIMKFHGDVGVWNELFTQDREDGVYIVYRELPYILPLITSDAELDAAIAGLGANVSAVTIRDSMVSSISVARTDANIANFFWVTAPRFDMISEVSRKLAGISGDDPTVSTAEYPNSAAKYYGVRPMMAQTQQAASEVESMTGGLTKDKSETRDSQQLDWISRRRERMMLQNRDNVLYEQGVATIKGGPLRNDGELMRAGDYAVFSFGRMRWLAYVVQVDHEYVPFQGYTTTLNFERGTGFAQRAAMDGSPWLIEQAQR